ncbi:hypothetical protein Chor_013342 [Crotalus horridus]
MNTGLEELHSALTDVQHVQEELGSIQKDLTSCLDSFRSLQELRELATKHDQLEAVVQMLPQLFSGDLRLALGYSEMHCKILGQTARVPQLISETFNFLQSQNFLRAHLGLMDLESLRDSILSQLHNRNLLSSLNLTSIESYFGGLLELNDALAQHLWHTVAHATKLVSEDPALFVSVVRIIEREESIDANVLLRSQPHGFLPPGRPKCWRRKFFQVIQDAIVASYFQAEPNKTQGQWLSSHLASLQSSILTELCIVKDLMVQCCPPHYNILTAFATMFHQGLSKHLHHILAWDLDKQEIFALLHWAIHVYPSSEMMSHPHLLPEVDVSALGPMLPADTIGSLEESYLGKVQASIAEWMQKALEMEFEEWLCGKEPESDYQGFFQTNLPIIAMKPVRETGRILQSTSARAHGLYILHNKIVVHCQQLLGSQPLFAQLPSRQWLLDDFQLMNSICEVIDKHADGFCRTHKPNSLYLLSEAEHLVMSQYVKSLLQKRMTCRTAEERSKMSTRMLQDTAQLKELFCALGLEEDKLSLKVIADLQQIISVKDPSMLGLEVLGFMTKYPDISEDHVSMFLYLRGDISKEICNHVLGVMVKNPQVLPENYNPVFSNILVPAPEMPFCLGKSKCA